MSEIKFRIKHTNFEYIKNNNYLDSNSNIVFDNSVYY